jgi:hypothetical protein
MVAGPDDRKTGEIFREVEPEDLLKYGLIPEFIGRLPVVATLEVPSGESGRTALFPSSTPGNMFRPKLEVGDIFRRHGEAWRGRNC